MSHATNSPKKKTTAEMLKMCTEKLEITSTSTRRRPGYINHNTDIPSAASKERMEMETEKGQQV